MFGLKYKLGWLFLCLMCVIPLDAGIFLVWNILKNPHLLSEILFWIDLFVGIFTVILSLSFMVVFAHLGVGVKKDE